MYEASLAKNLNLVSMESAANGMHVEASTFRFMLCGQQLAVERRFRDVSFEGVTFAQMQFEQNHFLQTRFLDCNFTDVIFRGCTFVKARFTGAVFANTHFQNCTFIDCEMGVGPIEPNVKFQNCLMQSGNMRLPKGADSVQNWLVGNGAPERAPVGFSILVENVAAKPAVAAAPTPEAIESRQREAEQVLPAAPKASAVRFSELEKN